MATNQQLADALKVVVQSKATRLMVVHRFVGDIDWSVVDEAIVEKRDADKAIIRVGGFRMMVYLNGSKLIQYI